MKFVGQVIKSRENQTNVSAGEFYWPKFGRRHHWGFHFSHFHF